MKAFPATPAADDAPDELLESGHLWLLEVVEGAPLRFQVQDSGLLRFGDRERVYDDPDAMPERYRHAVRHVREQLDRDALRDAVADVEDVVFFGVATVHERIDYDWERLPSFLGTDVWSADAGEFRPLDVAGPIFERLGLEPVNAVERELPTRDFDPDSYAMPESAWYDGPVAGVEIRNKRGGRAILRNPDVGRSDGATADERTTDDATDANDAAAEELATAFATAARFERLADELRERGTPVTAETLTERVLEDVAREAHPRRYRDGPVDRAALDAEVGALARDFLAARPDDAW